MPRLLQARPELTQPEIARELGISLGGVNFCLRALVDKGLVKKRRRSMGIGRVSPSNDTPLSLRTDLPAAGRSCKLFAEHIVRLIPEPAEGMPLSRQATKAAPGSRGGGMNPAL